MRSFIVVLFLFAALMIGRYAGGVVGISIGIFCYIHAWQQKKLEHAGLILTGFIVSIVLVFLAVFDFWPWFLLDWEFVDGRMMVSFFAQPWTVVRPWLTIVRVLVIFAAPLVVWTPYQWAEWALKMEMFYPKLREVPFATADPGSVQGSGVKAAKPHKVKPVLVTTEEQDRMDNAMLAQQGPTTAAAEVSTEPREEMPPGAPPDRNQSCT